MNDTVKEIMESKILPAKEMYGTLIALSLINNYEDSNIRYELLREFIKLNLKIA